MLNSYLKGFAMHNGILENCDEIYNVLDEHIIYSVTNSDGIITHVSEAFCLETGYCEDEIIGKTHSFLRAPDVPNLFYDDLWQTITAKKLWQGEIKNIRKDGETYWVNTIIQPMLNANNDLEGYIAIRHNITREKMIEERANFDALTGIYNRRKIDLEIHMQIKNFLRYKTAFSLVMFDVDHFKHFNDKYGHQMGDEVLKCICNTVKPMIREGDIFSRWGGEEFIILLPNATINEGRLTAEKIRREIEAKSSAFLFENFGIHEKLSCSFGVSEVKIEDSTDALIGRVDRALYQAKSAGRNCTVVA